MSLQITIIDAKNLPRTDEGGRGKIDPYFKVTFAGQLYQTKTLQNNLNPVWNETFTFHDSPQKDNLQFELYDDDGNGLTKLIATYIVSSDALPTGKVTVPLTQATGVSAGQVDIEIVHIAPPPPPQPVVVVQVPTPAPTVVVQTPAASAKSLQITIIEGKNLPLLSGGAGGGKKGGKADKIDPFFKVTFGNQLYQTQIYKDNQNPKFNETLTFQDSPKKDKVIFELYNNSMGTGQLIATFVLDSDKLPTGRATLPLQTPDGTSCGQLDVEIVHLETLGGVRGPGQGSQGKSVAVVPGPAPVVVVQGPAVVPAPAASAKSLQITIIEGKNLPLLSGGAGGGKKGGKADKIDPFFKVTFGNQLYQTQIYKDNQNPKFNETLTFQDSPKKDKVIFELYNNSNGTGQLIATFVLDSDKLPTGRATLPLQTPDGTSCGQLDVEIVHLETLGGVRGPGQGGQGKNVTVVQQAAPVQTVIVQQGGRKK